MARALGVLMAAGLACAAASLGVAAAQPARPTFDESGIVHVPGFDLPPSALSSQEAQDFMKLRAHMPSGAGVMREDVAAARAGLQAMLAPQVAQMLAAYPVNVAEETIAGVPVRVVIPRDGAFDRRRVLINLHGGAFQTCWESCSLLESAPIAAVGGYKVISVNYRMAPEAAHPAGVEDVAAVYRELLKNYRADHIGIYGCSAGGALTAQAAAWFASYDLPQPGGIGIFGAGAARFGRGDSAYIAGYIDGSFPPPPRPGEAELDMTRGYFTGADMSDSIISPAAHPEMMARFPPTLIITGTRAMDMSPAIYTNSQLLKAGRRSTLIVGEGMGHCYIYMPNMPEARDARAAIIAFFRENLR
jgi:epsilon-lactone hydrolase